ncbi:MAG: hypothetical protein WBW33_25860, partial [Bryobacteraceae bacterium]
MPRFMPTTPSPFSQLRPLLGISFWRLQLVFLAIAVAVSGLFWVILGTAHPIANLLFTFIIGNCTTLVMIIAAPFFGKRPFPWDWLIYLAILLPVAAAASSIASVATRIAYGHREHLFLPDWGDIRTGTFISLLTGASVYLSARARF